MRRTLRLAQAVDRRNTDEFLYHALTVARASIVKRAKLRGLDWQAIERADYSESGPSPCIAPAHAPSVDEVSPGD